MHAGQTTKMKRAAVWACAIPVGLGISLLPLLLLFLPRLLHGRDSETEIQFWFVVAGLMALGLSLSAPLSAWLACRNLAKVEDIYELRRWKTSAVRAARSASLVHAGATILFTTIICCVMIFVAGGIDGTVDDKYLLLVLFNIVLFAALYNIALWIVFTLPFSLICATIFWKITKFPSDINVHQADL